MEREAARRRSADAAEASRIRERGLRLRSRQRRVASGVERGVVPGGRVGVGVVRVSSVNTVVA